MAQAGPADADRAVGAAKAAFRGWAAATAFERADALRRVAAAAERRRDELARALHARPGQADLGVLRRGGRARRDAARLRGGRAAARGLDPAEHDPGRPRAADAPPKGPVAVITPWNWPYTMPAEIVAPALAVGNTVVWTPAPSTSVCSGLLAECFAEADLPPGVFNFLPGEGPVAGDAIVSHPTRSPSASSAPPRRAGGSPSARRARRCCSRWAATGRSSCSTTPTWRRPPTPRSPPASSAPGRAAPPASGCSSTRRCARTSSPRWPSARWRSRGSATRCSRARRWARSTTSRSRRRWTRTSGTRSTRGAAVVAGGERAGGFPTDLYWPADDPRRRAGRRARRDRGDLRADRADRRHRLARGGDRADQRLALRPDGGDLHAATCARACASRARCAPAS